MTHTSVVVRPPIGFLTAAPDMTEFEPACLCGHRERDHMMSGRCRVPGCLCERFEPMPGIGIRGARR
jgi:hypothetical protein